MNLNDKSAAPANDDARLKILKPGMAEALATAPVNLDNPSECYDLLVTSYRHDDVVAGLSQAIVQARLQRARAA